MFHSYSLTDCGRALSCTVTQHVSACGHVMLTYCKYIVLNSRQMRCVLCLCPDGEDLSALPHCAPLLATAPYWIMLSHRCMSLASKRSCCPWLWLRLITQWVLVDMQQMLATIMHMLPLRLYAANERGENRMNACRQTDAALPCTRGSRGISKRLHALLLKFTTSRIAVSTQFALVSCGAASDR